MKPLVIIRNLIRDDEQMSLAGRIANGDGAYADKYESDVIIDEEDSAGEMTKS